MKPNPHKSSQRKAPSKETWLVPWGRLHKAHGPEHERSLFCQEITCSNTLLAQPQYRTPSAVRRRSTTKSGETSAHVAFYLRYKLSVELHVYKQAS
jgi:hypothetical protein